MRRFGASVLVAGALALPPVVTASAQSTTAHVSSGWRRGATCYEAMVRSFATTDGDSVGTLRALTARLDYLSDARPGRAATNRSLGVQCLWLMPIHPSPSYHGYDVSDYYGVDARYGTLDDVRTLVREAHARGIAVFLDLVLNHTSSAHPWFRAAIADSTSKYRSWYRFRTTPSAEKGAWGQDVWHQVPGKPLWYYGTFWRDMPDLDWTRAEVRAEADRISDFWVGQIGIDGFRLDAVPYLVEDGATLIGAKGTHDVLRGFAAHLRAIYPDAFTVGEVWDGIDKMLPYYPDQLEQSFAFDLSDLIITTARGGDGKELLSRIQRYEREVPNQRWGIWVRNHDQTRALTAVGGDTARAAIAATLALTLPGLPFVYYGEEIGMMGDKPDENLRRPMTWPAVTTQASASTSLWSRYRDLIAARRRSPALDRGRVVPLNADQPGVVSYLRIFGADVALVVINTSDAVALNTQLRTDEAKLLSGSWRPQPLVGSLPMLPMVANAKGALATRAALPPIPPRSATVVRLVH